MIIIFFSKKIFVHHKTLAKISGAKKTINLKCKMLIYLSRFIVYEKRIKVYGLIKKRIHFFKKMALFAYTNYKKNLKKGVSKYTS